MDIIQCGSNFPQSASKKKEKKKEKLTQISILIYIPSSEDMIQKQNSFRTFVELWENQRESFFIDTTIAITSISVCVVQVENFVRWETSFPLELLDVGECDFRAGFFSSSD